MDHLHHIRTESEAFLTAALEGSMDTPVTSCPGWTVADLVGHLGVVQRFHGTHLLRGVTDRPTEPRPRPPETGLADWFRAGTDQLVDNLSAVGMDTPAWNFLDAEPRTTAFWHRRMAMEAAIHRWDAQFVRQAVQGFDVDLAVDGIGEVLDVHVPGRRADDAPEGTVSVALTDDDRTWRVVCGDAEAAAATISGSAGLVWLALWGRLPLTDVDTSGDADLARSVVIG